MRKKISTLVVCLMVCMVLATQQTDNEFIKVHKSDNRKTPGQLKEKIAQLLEALAYRLTLQIGKLAQAQYSLIDRMHELASQDSHGVFSGASHKKLQEYVVQLERQVAQAESTLKELASLNRLLEEK